MKRQLVILAVLISLLLIGSANNETLRSNLEKVLIQRSNTAIPLQKKPQTSLSVTSEESAVIGAIDKALPSVVTIGISKTTRTRDFLEIDPFDPFAPFKRTPGQTRQIEQNIGSGFIVSTQGLIVTNKHVVADVDAGYKVITNDNKTYEVKNISRDPLNDLAILKIDAKDLTPLTLGDSSTLKLGQYVIAIGTPLGEFQNTVTTGIISGLKRGITAGSPFEGSVERLDNVIQTDAAISPGNSGGPLVNLLGEVIGVNTAVSSEGQNIGFAIPINVVKELMDNFNAAGGKIERPFLGIRYHMVAKRDAVLNSVAEGAYIIEVVENSPAEKAGLQPDDIIIEMNGQKITGDDDTAIQKQIASKKIGDRVLVKIWRNGEMFEKTIILSIFE